MNYLDKLKASIQQTTSVLCAGLDPVPEHFPPAIRSGSSSESAQTIAFCEAIINGTQTLAAAYKLNLAFFEALGTDAFTVLKEVLARIPADKIVIADAKRGDVPHTNARYKKTYFDQFGFDAITLSPFMGVETMAPFLEDEGRAVYALTLTSNAGANDFMTRPFGDAPMLSLYLAKLLADAAKNYPGALGMVIGATQSDQYAPVFQAYPQAPLLIPGIGAQGGSVDGLEKELRHHPGLPLINVSRGLSSYEPDCADTWEAQIFKNAQNFHSLLKNISQTASGATKSLP